MANRNFRLETRLKAADVIVIAGAAELLVVLAIGLALLARAW